MKIEKKLSGNQDKDGYSSSGDMGSPVLHSSNSSFLTIVMTLNLEVNWEYGATKN